MAEEQELYCYLDALLFNRKLPMHPQYIVPFMSTVIHSGHIVWSAIPQVLFLYLWR